jgi:hypothetical protein
MRTASEPVERWVGVETLARLERAVAEHAEVAALNSFQTGAGGPQTVAHAFSAEFAKLVSELKKQGGIR